MKQRIIGLIDARIAEIERELERRRSPTWIRMTNDPYSGHNYGSIIRELKVLKAQINNLLNLEIEK